MEVRDIIVREYKETDLPRMMRIWNEVVAEGNAFPQTDLLDEKSARAFFASQTETAVAQDKNSEELLGLYILHPNNIGRCGHIANASFAVSSQYRGLHIGEKLVRDCLERAKTPDLKSFSSTPLCSQTSMRAICMNGSALSASAGFRADSELKTAVTKLFIFIILNYKTENRTMILYN